MNRCLWITACGLLAGCGVELNPMQVAETRPPDPTEAIAAAQKAATQPAQPAHVVAVPFPETPRKDVTIIDNGPGEVYIPVPVMPEDFGY